MKKHRYKSIINKRLKRHGIHLMLAVFLLISGLSLGKIGGTNSFFMDNVSVENNNFSAGYWIPVLTMSVDPENPDGEEGWYKTNPCVTLTASVTDPTDTEIFYRLLPGGSYLKYSETCIEIPDGEWDFDAYAIFNGNSDWKSNVINEEFKVNTSIVEPGDVIINEVMWMGSQDNEGTNHTADEWIELYNTTGHDIDIKNWNIYGAVTGGGGHLEIAGGSEQIIPAHGYFLIANYSKSDSAINEDVDLRDTAINFNNEYDDNGQIILKDTGGNTIDHTPSPSGSDWPEGENEDHQKWSMERNDDGSGWHTCDPTASGFDLTEMKSYWDDDANEYNCGTPGHKNMSDNDPSHRDEENLANTEENRGEAQTEEIIPGNDNILPADTDEGKAGDTDGTGDNTADDLGTEPEGASGSETSSTEAVDPPPADPDPVDPPTEDKIEAPDPKPAETVKEPEEVKEPEPPKEETPKEEIPKPDAEPPAEAGV